MDDNDAMPPIAVQLHARGQGGNHVYQYFPIALFTDTKVAAIFLKLANEHLLTAEMRSINAFYALVSTTQTSAGELLAALDGNQTHVNMQLSRLTPEDLHDNYNHIVDIGSSSCKSTFGYFLDVPIANDFCKMYESTQFIFTHPKNSKNNKPHLGLFGSLPGGRSVFAKRN